jgi:hypothetical protein
MAPEIANDAPIEAAAHSRVPGGGPPRLGQVEMHERGAIAVVGVIAVGCARLV